MMKTSTPPRSGGGNVVASSNPGNTSSSTFKLFLLIMMAVQNTSVVLVGRYTQAGVAPEDKYVVNHLIFITELTKFLLACALEFHATAGHLLTSLQTHVFQKPLDALKILVPALLYVLQNSLLYVAFANLTAPIFQVTYQGKLVTTAIVSVIMLQRKYNKQQWICLVALSLGVATCVLGEKKDDPSQAQAKDTNLFVGLTAVTIACLCSALAGVYFEKVLKKTTKDATKGPPASLWMRNIQMAFFSFCIAAIQGMMQPASDKPYLHGFHGWVWILVGLQAGGGLLVAAVIKYADNVLKGLATGVSVVSSSISSMLLFGTPLSGQFWGGAVVILSSVYYFSNPLPAALTKRSGEQEGLLPK